MKKNKYIVAPKTQIKLSDYPAEDTGPFKNKEEAAQKLDSDIAKLPELQARLYAQDNYALLIILQGIDAAGKDGTIKHVMSGVNPTGCQVTSFKSPSQGELDTTTTCGGTSRLCPRARHDRHLQPLLLRRSAGGARAS